MKKLQNFINGNYYDPLSGKYIDNYNPSTGKIYSLVPDSNKEDIDFAYESAKNAFPIWSDYIAQERANILYKIADLLEDNIPEFAKAESIDQGKPFKLASTVDIPRAIHNFRFFAGAILHHENKSSDFNNNALNYTSRKPIGVVGLISPWNLPLYLLTWKIAPAIACGNTVIAKPSEFTSMTAYLLGNILNQAGLPKGVCNIVFGTGQNTGEPLVTHPKIKAISFTGGTKTGQKIIELSAPNFKKLSLELGGKNPNIIFNDADLEECIETTVRSSFLNQGEICLCGSRIFVQEEIYNDFLSKFIEKVKLLKTGNPLDESTNVGALISKQHLEKVEYYINLAKEEGGEIVLGGTKPNYLEEENKEGYFLEPCIITALKSGCRVMNEEIFGPVVTISIFKTTEEVIEYANSTPYGLSASIWTNNLKLAHQVSEELDVGTVWVNTWMMRDLRVPFGGTKFSGLGREGGEYSIDFYTETKNICIKYK